MNVLIKYRADKRIKVVEVRTGNRKFLCNLDLFSLDTGVRDFEESTSGEVGISLEEYKTLWEDRRQ